MVPLELAHEALPPPEQVAVLDRIRDAAASEGPEALIRGFTDALASDSTNSYVWFALGAAEESRGDHAGAARAYSRAADFVPFAVWGLHQAAAQHTLAGEPDAAISALRLARDRGYSDHEELSVDPDLDGLRRDPRFGSLLRDIVAEGHAHQERHASWSPDGTRIAFSGSSAGTGTWDVFVVNADGTGLGAVTHSTSNDFQPSWSPDGGWIAFSRSGPFGGARDVYRIRPDGTGLTRVTGPNLFLPGGDKSFPEWSPDSRSIVLRGRGGDWDAGVWRLPLDGSDPLRLVESGEWPSYFPDGDRLLFETRELSVIATSSGAVTRLGPPDGWIAWAASISPDGRTVAASVFARSTRVNQIGLIDVETGAMDVVTPPRYDAWMPTWSPDGETLLFSLSPNAFGHGGRALHLIDRDGSNLRPLSTEWEELR